MVPGADSVKNLTRYIVHRIYLHPECYLEYLYYLGPDQIVSVRGLWPLDGGGPAGN